MSKSSQKSHTALCATQTKLFCISKCLTAIFMCGLTAAQDVK